MNIEDRIVKLEQTIESLDKQLQNFKKILLECARITTTVEKAAKSLNSENSEIIKILEKAAKAIAPPAPQEVKVVEPIKAEVIVPQEVKVEAAVKIESNQELLNLVNSTTWPAAVDPALIIDVNSDQEKEDRAEGILDLIIDVHLENLRFLDFGCGEGHVVNKSRTQKPKMSVGYDINKSAKWETWEKAPNILFTVDWGEVKQMGPYNIVLMYDVIDHMLWPEPDIIQRLKEAKSLLAPNGKIFVRCHPWSSKHATHLYHQLNKAYAHLILSEEEIEKMGYKQEKIRKIKHPITDYKKLFTDAGLRIHSGPHEIKEGVEPFFINTKIVRDKIQEHYKDSIWEHVRKGDFPSGPLEIQFIDYILM